MDMPLSNKSPHARATGYGEVSRMRNPAYSRVRVISQLILDEYLEPRGLREIMDETRAKRKGYYSGDIARLVAAELATEGIKVWR